MSQQKFSALNVDLARFGFSPVLREIRVTCLDVGARGGFARDLLPIAGSVRAIGFEPDKEECERLNLAARGGRQPWQELRFVPTALGGTNGQRELNIYQQRGCSSFLAADSQLASRFSRDHYYVLERTVNVPTLTADYAAQQHDFEDAAFFKLDVQGAELEILNGSKRLLTETLVGLRTEVSFVPLYKDQPLFADIDRALRRHGFLPMRILELHSWRRSSMAKLPHLDSGPIPYSQGQMVHGDVLYLRDPESLPDNNDAAVERLVRAALVASAYGLIDHAMAIFQRPAVKAMMDDRFRVDASKSLAALSSSAALAHKLKPATRLFKALARRLAGRR